MKFARPLLIAASGLALLISACSTPTDLVVESQFGTAQYDRADVTVTDAQRGYTYVAGATRADLGGEFDGYMFIRRYNQDSSLAWEQRSSGMGAYNAAAKAVRLDAAGNVYLGNTGDPFDDGALFADVSKLSPAGKLLYKIDIDENIQDMEVDASGNVYLSGFDLQSPNEDDRFFLRKYGVQGKLVWERLRVQPEGSDAATNPAPIERPGKLGLGSDGSLYVTGIRNTLTKYSNSGKVLWQKTASTNDATAVTASGQNIYLATNVKTSSGVSSVVLQKFNSSGSLLWQKTIPASEGVFAKYVAVDASGNVYLSGSKKVGADTDLFARKYTAAGGVSWTYAPRLAGTNESANGVSAKVSSNVYLAGVTDGKVNGVNKGFTDAFLIRLNAQGQKVWSR